ncbi:MAG: BadF/BadG/BcrA/BcrD ATPase family protein [Gemmataceae bacterium]
MLSLHATPLVLGINGGATSTTALLADATTGREVGRGTSGPANIQAVGTVAAFRSLNTAVGTAFHAAGKPRGKVAAAALGLAGVDLAGVDLIRGWTELVTLADRASITDDATLLFAAEHLKVGDWLSSGALALSPSRSTKTGSTHALAGGAYLLGDEGSAYRIGLLALRAACRSADGVTPPTAASSLVTPDLLYHRSTRLTSAYSSEKWDNATIAALAPLVMELAPTDATAADILEDQASELAKTAVGAVTNGKLPKTDVPIALAGGLLLRSEAYRSRFLAKLQNSGVTPGPVGLVHDPAVGAITLARKLLPRE